MVPAQSKPDADHLIALPHRASTFDRRKALLVALALWAGFAVMVWLVLHQRTGGFDRWGLLVYRTGDALSAKGPALLLESVRDLTALGGVLLRNLFALAAVAALLFLRLRREAVLFVATITSGWIVNTLIKLAVGRPRPEIVPHLTSAGGASFPSGHSFNAALVYIAMALAFASLSARHSVRVTVVACAMVLSALIAWTRVMLGVHFPSDVVSGWLGGAGWAFMAGALFYRPARAVADANAAAIEAATPGTRLPGPGTSGA